MASPRLRPRVGCLDVVVPKIWKRQLCFARCSSLSPPTQEATHGLKRLGPHQDVRQRNEEHGVFCGSSGSLLPLGDITV